MTDFVERSVERPHDDTSGSMARSGDESAPSGGALIRSPGDVRSGREFDFLVRLGVALHRYGAPAHRLEPCVEVAARQLGLEVEVSVEPTALHIAWMGRDGAPPQTRFIRTTLGTDDLGRLAALDDLVSRVQAGGTIETWDRELDRILTSSDRRPIPVEALAAALVSACASRFLGAQAWTEIGFALVAGLGAHGLMLFFEGRKRLPVSLGEGVVAFAVATGLTLLGGTLGPTWVDVEARDRCVVAALIMLVPGLRMTVVAQELAANHFASGVARFASSAVSFAALAYGTVLGHRFGLSLGFVPQVVSHEAGGAQELPSWSWWLALAAASWTFSVLLRASRSDAPWIAVCAPVALLGAALGEWIAEGLGALVGAFALVAASHAHSRLRNRPASVTLLPGTLLLVPGSLGFVSLSALWTLTGEAGALDEGLRAAVRTLFVAASIVAGILLGAAVVPPRRTL